MDDEEKKGGYIGSLLKKADESLQEGVKKADVAISEAVKVGTKTAKQAAEVSKKIGAQAEKEGSALQKKGAKTISDLASGKYKLNPKENLELIEKLASMKDAGILTQDEFQTKKEEILDRT